MKIGEYHYGIMPIIFEKIVNKVCKVNNLIMQHYDKKLFKNEFFLKRINHVSDHIGDIRYSFLPTKLGDLVHSVKWHGSTV